MIISENSSTFLPCPPGNHMAVCVDVIDLGVVESEYAGEKRRRRMCKLQWQVAPADEDGKEVRKDDGRRFVVTATTTASLNDKAKLRAWLEAWRGRAFTADELKAFDLETIVGAGCMLQVEHRQSSAGRTYGAVKSISAVPVQMRRYKLTPENFLRVCEGGDGWGEKAERSTLSHDDSNQPPNCDMPISDDDVPF